MSTRGRFEFELYRLNVVDSEDVLLEHYLPNLSGNDAAIIEVIEHAASPRFRYQASTESSAYSWDLRQFMVYSESSDDLGAIVGVTLARSTDAQTGPIVTDTGIVEGVSLADPPQARTMEIIFRMSRHVIAVERYTLLTSSQAWRRALEDLLRQAAVDKKMRGRIELEPIPKNEEIMTAFRSFDRLTRLRLVLRLPNPELSRYAQELYNEMVEGGVREYLQDMSNGQGLNREEGKLPHASVEIAQKGYKKGAVRMVGVRNGRRTKVDTGGKAARGQLDSMRDFVRGINVNARSQEAKNVIKSIAEEMDRIAPPPESSIESGEA